MLKANPKLLDNGAYSMTASNMEKDLGVDEAAQGAELLDRTDNTAASNMKDFRATHKGRKAIYPEIEDRAQDERQVSGRVLHKMYSFDRMGGWRAEEIARLIRIKRENPFMFWEEVNKRQFQDKTLPALQHQWCRLLKDSPKLLDLTVSEDVIITDLAHLRSKAQWTREEEATLIETKRLHPDTSWGEIKEKTFPDRAESALALKWSSMLKANPRLLDSTAYEDLVISKSVHLEQLWTPKTTDHLIEVKKAHPEMSWLKIKEKFFPTRTEKFLSTKWGKILRADPEILQDLTTSRDRGWNPEEEAFLIDIKRSHPLWTWERI